MSGRAVGCGLDFGTSNSSIAVAYEDRVEVLKIDPSSILPNSLPSMGYLHRNGNQSAGVGAVDLFLVTGGQQTLCDRCSLVIEDLDGPYSECRQFTRGGACQDARLIASVKTELANGAFTHTHSWARDFPIEELVAVILRDLKRRAEQVAEEELERVVIGYPVAFSGSTGPDFEELQELGKTRLTNAALGAGFSDVELYPEPAAAVLDEVLDDGIVVSVDFGGGTFDVAVIQITNGEGEITSLQGASVGGNLLDGDLFDLKVASSLGLDTLVGSKNLSIPAWFRERLRTMGGMKYLLSDPFTRPVLSDLAKADPRAGALVDSVLFGGHGYRFYRAIEEAKIALSHKEVTRIEFHPPGVDLSVEVTRAELEAVSTPYLEVIEAQINRALLESGCETNDVTAVIRTGGSSRLSGFVRMLERMFGEARVRERDAFTSVAYGLGVYAQEVWG